MYSNRNVWIHIEKLHILLMKITIQLSTQNLSFEKNKSLTKMVDLRKILKFNKTNEYIFCQCLSKKIQLCLYFIY